MNDLREIDKMNVKLYSCGIRNMQSGDLCYTQGFIFLKITENIKNI